MSSGGDSTVEYTQSPEQRQVLQATLPMLQGLGQYGMERYFSGAPNMGAPSMQGVLTSTPMYDIPTGYDIPGRTIGGYGITDPTGAMPTADWWGSLSPNVKAGLYAPYVEAGQGLLEAMGSKGQLGSPTGGYSGSTGVALGELAGQAAKNVGLNAWQMTSPALMATLGASNVRNRDIWSAQTGAGRDIWQADLARSMGMWGEDLARNRLGYQQRIQESLGDYGTAMDVWQRPFQAMGMMPAGMPQGYIQGGGGGGLGSMLGGGLMGGLGAASVFAGQPYMWPAVAAGGLLGGLGGIFG